MTEDELEEFDCLDCRLNTHLENEYYMLLDEIWLEAHPEDDGMLCVTCVERRLGRKLLPADFANVPINLIWPHSEILDERLSGGGTE